MTPGEYYPDKYQRDLDVFRDVSNGSSLDLCPLTLGNYLKDARMRNDVSSDCFFACQYCLNLIAQAVHSYFPQFSFRSVDYLDVQGCYSHSFRSGEYSRPIDLISYLKSYGIIISMEMLNEYTEYLIEELLPVHLPDVSIDDLSKALLADADCIEVHPCLESMTKKRRGSFSMRIGELVKYHIPKIFHHCDTVDHEELSRLTSLDYSNHTFGINFPFCIELDQIPPDQSNRYWRHTFTVCQKNVRVTSQWYATNNQKFCDYLLRLGITTMEELSVLSDIPRVPTEPNCNRNLQAARNSRYRGNAIGNAQNLLVRNILSNLGHESFSENDWNSTKDHFSNQCAYCGADGDLVIEHVIPINRTSLGEHRIGNLVPSCRSCNVNKGDRDYREFLADEPLRLEFIQSYMDSKNYVPLGDNEQVAMVLEIAYKEVSSVADRYIAILNELFPSE